MTTAPCDGADGLDQLNSRATFGQVTRSASVQQLSRIRCRFMHGQDDNSQARINLLEPSGNFKSRQARKADIEQHHIGLYFAI